MPESRNIKSRNSGKPELHRNSGLPEFRNIKVKPGNDDLPVCGSTGVENALRPELDIRVLDDFRPARGIGRDHGGELAGRVPDRLRPL
jgi:hypothetical protein